jgi:hypothetical protein
MEDSESFIITVLPDAWLPNPKFLTTLELLGIGVVIRLEVFSGL